MSAASPSGEGSPFGLIAAGIVGNAMSRQTRAILGRGDSPRSGQPVWRNSYYEGQMEDRLWRPVGLGRQRGTVRGGRRYAGAVVKAARAFDRRTRSERKSSMPGTRNGVLGEVGVAVLEVLYDIVDFRTGRLEPAIQTIADRTGYCYSAVHDALCRLRRAGFLHWIRRSKPTENQGEAGPQVEQIPNAYVLLLPTEFERLVRGLLGEWGGDDARVPECEQDRRKAQKGDLEAMLATITASHYHSDFWAGDKLTGESFARIAALLDAKERQERESPRARETGGSS